MTTNLEALVHELEVNQTDLEALAKNIGDSHGTTEAVLKQCFIIRMFLLKKAIKHIEAEIEKELEKLPLSQLV